MNTLPTERSVLVRVDVQNDFIDGSLAVAEGRQVVTPLNEVASTVRASGGQVVNTRDWHPPVTPHFDTWPVHCVAETEGAELHPALQVEESDILLSKGMGQTDGYSGWEGVSEDGQTLETIIEPKSLYEKVRVLIGGLATDFCVEATALSTAGRFADDDRVEILLLRDAIRAVNLTADAGERAIKAMEDAGIVAITCAEARALVEESVR